MIDVMIYIYIYNYIIHNLYTHSFNHIHLHVGHSLGCLQMRAPYLGADSVGRPSNASLNWACHAKAKVGVLDLQNLRRDVFESF